MSAVCVYFIINEGDFQRTIYGLEILPFYGINMPCPNIPYA